jgi:hypothetical protein
MCAQDAEVPGSPSAPNQSATPQLSEYDRWIIDHEKDVAKWPVQTFRAYMIAEVPEDQWDEFILKRAHPSVTADWPLFRQQRWNIAQDQPVVLAVGGDSKTSRERSLRVLRRIKRHPRIHWERRRLEELWNQQTADGATNWEILVHTYGAALETAERLNMRGVSPADVTSYLFWSVAEPVAQMRQLFPDTFDDEELEAVRMSGSKTTVYVNLCARPIPFLMPPGQILLDATNSSEADRSDLRLRTAIREMQVQLNLVRPQRGRPTANEDMYARTRQSLRLDGKTWKEVFAILRTEFPDRAFSETSFQQQYYRWEKRQRSRSQQI